MKKYFNHLIWKPAAKAAAVLVPACLLLMPRGAKLAAALLVLACFAAYFSVNRLCQKLFLKAAPTSYFQDLRFRNMDALLVGSTAAWRLGGNEKCYDATGFKRSGEMTFAMLQTYYSHMKEDGTVFYVVDPVEAQSIGAYISPSDFACVHPQVFLKMGVSYPERSRYNPLLTDRRYALSFLTACLTRPVMRRLNTAYSMSGMAPLNADGAKETNQELRRLDTFCRERGLACRLIIVDRGGVKAHEDALLDSVGLQAEFVRRPGELKAAVAVR